MKRKDTLEAATPLTEKLQCILNSQLFTGRQFMGDYFIVFRHKNLFLELKDTLELIYSNHLFLQQGNLTPPPILFICFH